MEYKRKSIRLPGYNYSRDGYYFITICTRDHQQILAKIQTCRGLIHQTLSQCGEITKDCWLGIPQYSNDVELDEYVIMPNHIHGIIQLRNNCDKKHQNAVKTAFKDKKVQTTLQAQGLMTRSDVLLGRIIRYFKAKSARLIHLRGFRQFSWQPNYYEHIIRDQNDLNRIREYITTYPARWEHDEYFAYGFDSSNPP